MIKYICLAVAVFLLGLLVGASYPLLRSHSHGRDGAHIEVPAPAVPATGEVRIPADSPQLSQIRTGIATLSEVPLTEPLPARLAFDETRTTRVSSPVSGRITSLLANVGDPVRAGQPLARIDSPDFSAAVADVEKSRAEAAHKSAALVRARGLFDAGLAAKRDLESAEAEDVQAAAELRRAQQRLSNLTGERRVASPRFELAAPIAGWVVDRQANPGMEVRPDLQNPLFVISDLTSLWALVDVPEHSLAAISVGSLVQLEVAAYPDRTFEGRVALVSPVLDPQTRRVQARVVIDNAARMLRPEMYAKALVSTADGRKAIRVPIGALMTGGERNYVFVQTAAGTFARRAVDLAVQSRDFAYVSRGLEVGDHVVTTGAILLASELSQ